MVEQEIITKEQKQATLNRTQDIFQTGGPGGKDDTYQQGRDSMDSAAQNASRIADEEGPSLIRIFMRRAANIIDKTLSDR